MSKTILNNDVLDIIYDSICGYPLEDAYKILEDHRRGMYISVDWIEKWMRKSENTYNREQVYEMLSDWEKENEGLV